MKSLTIAYITSRPEPELEWFYKSLGHQIKAPVTIIVITRALEGQGSAWRYDGKILSMAAHAPKPTVWQGPMRLTKADWWAAANARNTALCLCSTEWIAFVDDRSVLLPGWMDAVEAAMVGEYAVCGPYEKRVGVTVENGYIKNGGIITGQDNRLAYVKAHWTDPRHKLTNPYDCPGNWWYGCSTACPLEWALQVGGYDETCDGLSGEDYIFGMMLKNNNYPIKYDTRLAIVEDRTAEKLGPAMIRRDKGTSPNDKSHALLEMLKGQREAQHGFDIRKVRASALATGGSAWPLPWGPTKDFYDGQPLSEMEPG